MATPGFYFELRNVRSLRHAPTNELLMLLRTLLWVDSMDTQSLDEKIVRRLIADGMAYMDPNGR